MTAEGPVARSWTVGSLCELIWQVENELSLLQFEIAGVKPWHGLRMEIYYELAQRLGVLEKPHSYGDDWRARLRHSVSIAYSAIRWNPYRSGDRVDAVVLPHQRKMMIDGQNVDIYTRNLVEELRGKGVSLEVLERRFQNRHLGEIGSGTSRVDLISVAGHLSSRLPYRHTKHHEESIHVIRNRFRELCGVDLDLHRKFSRYIKRFRCEYALFRRLFAMKKPREVYVVVAYALAPLVAAARDAGSEVIELQHGTFSKFHLGYSFPGSSFEELNYLPTKFLAWSTYWKQMCPLPLPPERIEVRPHALLATAKARYALVEKVPGKVLVISQGVLGRRLAEFIQEAIPELGTISIDYKLHPGEADRWRDYPGLKYLSRLPQVHIHNDNSTSLYRLMAEAESVIGVFSTAVYEAMEFGCRPVLLDLPGVEYMSQLLESGTATLVSRPNELANALRSPRDHT